MRYQLDAFCLAQSRTKISIIKRTDLVKSLSIHDTWLYIHSEMMFKICYAMQSLFSEQLS